MKNNNLQERITYDMRIKGAILSVAMIYVGWILFKPLDPNPFVIVVLTMIFTHHYRRSPKGSDVNEKSPEEDKKT